MKKQKLEILVVEDIKLNWLILSSILRKKGHSVSLAENGKLAVDIINKNKFDVVLMDIMMPIMDGIEATKEIRKNIDCTTPIIAVTANAFNDEKQNCINAGMNGFIAKPVKNEILEQEFNNIGLIF